MMASDSVSNPHGKAPREFSMKDVITFLCRNTNGKSNLACVLRNVATEIGQLEPGSNVIVDVLPNHVDLIDSSIFKDASKHIARFKLELHSGLGFLVTGEHPPDESSKKTHSDEADPLLRARRSVLLTTGGQWVFITGTLFYVLSLYNVPYNKVRHPYG